MGATSSTTIPATIESTLGAISSPSPAPDSVAVLPKPATLSPSTPSPALRPVGKVVGYVVSGSVGISVPDLTAYVTPGSVQSALKRVWAAVIASITLQNATSITVEFSAGRRLR